VKRNDAVEEGAGDRRRRVWVTEGDEVGVPREGINHREDDRLPVDLRKAFNKVHGDVCPHLRGNLKGLEQPRRSLGRRLVALARRASADIVLHQLLVTGNVEVGAETLQGLVDALVAS